MADKPILFSGPMVRALLDGRKTQTRRILPVQPATEAGYFHQSTHFSQSGGFATFRQSLTGETKRYKFAFKPGDRLWVREAWNAFDFSQDGDDAWPCEKIPTLEEILEIAEFGARVSPPQAVYRESDRARKFFTDQPWRPGIHMPRWASRLTNCVTNVTVQRLQDITAEDAEAEGLLCGETESGDLVWSGIHQEYPIPEEHCCHWPEEAFAILWNSINAKPKPIKTNGKVSHYVSYPWGGEARTETHRGKPHHIHPNPWVTATTFTVHKCNIDQMGDA